MKSKEYPDLICAYIKKQFGHKNIDIFKEISIGRTIIGKRRRIDILIICKDSNKAFAIECKCQLIPGTVDEKIPYAINDLIGSHIDGCICYAGDGFSEGVLHMLEAFPSAAYCLPEDNLESTAKTKDLDDLLAINFSWWDVITKDKSHF